MIQNAITLFGLYCFGHALADYPLQGDFLAKAKNHKAPIPGVPFGWALFMHSMIHAGFVYLITLTFTYFHPLKFQGFALLLAGFELFIHMQIDYTKCDGRLSFNHDQLAHLLCKVLYVEIFVLTVL